MIMTNECGNCGLVNDFDLNLDPPVYVIQNANAKNYYSYLLGLGLTEPKVVAGYGTDINVFKSDLDAYFAGGGTDAGAHPVFRDVIRF